MLCDNDPLGGGGGKKCKTFRVFLLHLLAVFDMKFKFARNSWMKKNENLSKLAKLGVLSFNEIFNW
jgi:hypothetical protein